MNLLVEQITRRDVMERYRLLCSDHGIGMANRAMRVLSSALNYGKALYPSLEDLSNPIAILSETRSRKPLRPRTGHIPVESLGNWLAALDTYVSECRTDAERARREDIRLLLKLLLMTGLRSTEGRSLKWSDLDLQRGILTVLAERAKNHREAHLPLNSWLIQQLTMRSSGGSGYVFPNRGAGGYIRNLRRPLDRLAQLSGLEIKPHDLRRSYATYLDAIGAPFGVIKQLLNHASSSDVTERYIQRRGIEEPRRYSEDLLRLIAEKRQDE